MKKFSLWKSPATNTVYAMPIDWKPMPSAFGKWEFKGTTEAKDAASAMAQFKN